MCKLTYIYIYTVTAFKYTILYFILPPGPRSLASPPHIQIHDRYIYIYIYRSTVYASEYLHTVLHSNYICKYVCIYIYMCTYILCTLSLVDMFSSKANTWSQQAPRVDAPWRVR